MHLVLPRRTAPPSQTRSYGFAIAQTPRWMCARLRQTLFFSSRPRPCPRVIAHASLPTTSHPLTLRAPCSQTLLHSANLGHVLRAVSSLEMFSLISPVVCSRMVVEGAVPVLFTLLTTCNRSAPHQKIVSHALHVMLNVARHPKLLPALWRQQDALPVLVELLQARPLPSCPCPVPTPCQPWCRCFY